MKTRKLVFKFIDNDEKTCKVFIYVVHSSYSPEWTEEKGKEDEKHIEWEVRHLKWEKMLKHHVKQMLLKKYFGGEHALANYRLAKKDMCKKKCMKNVSDESSNVMHFKVVFLMEKYKFKFCKGTKPVHDAHIHDYKKEIKIHHYYIQPPANGQTMEESLNLIDLGCEVNVPQNFYVQGSSTPINFNTNNFPNGNRIFNNNNIAYPPPIKPYQNGGDDDDYERNRNDASIYDNYNDSAYDNSYKNKYLKYKNKYVDLKNGNGNGNKISL